MELIRRWLLVVIGVNLVALAALVFIYPHLMVAPGPLVTEHSALTSDCFACHTPLRGVASARCAACHVAADIGVRTTKGVVLAPAAGKVRFHQALVEQNCMACHTDHKGPKFAPALGKGFSHLLLRSDLRDDAAFNRSSQHLDFEELQWENLNMAAAAEAFDRHLDPLATRLPA